MKTQLEMSLEAANVPALIPGYTRLNRNRARGWFQQMRRVVESTVARKPTPPPRPEQTRLALDRHSSW